MPSFSVKTIPSWKGGELPTACGEVLGAEDRDCQPEPNRSLALHQHEVPRRSVDPLLHRRLCSRSYLRRGSEVYIRYDNGEAHISLATRK